MQLLLCSILYLCTIFMSCRHLIAWVSKVAFIISGCAWSCNFVLPLCCHQPSSCIHYLRFIHCICCVHCIRYAAFSFCSWCCLLWYLDVVFYEQLDIFMSRQAHRNLIVYISRCALNGVFDFALFKTIIHALLRGRWKPKIPRDLAKLMASNLSIENQNELQN